MKQKKQILIIEDSDINREMLREILADEYDILEAENGQEGLDILKKNKETVTIILLDLMMPVMDGYGFLDEVKKDTSLSMIPIIMMTQAESEMDEVDALVHGATDFIPKPYRPKVMKQRMANLIKLRESSAMINQIQFDPLTGLYTKEFFYRKVRERLDENPQKEYSIICCNLENFKLYNDTCGRKAGDDMLREEARIFQERVGQSAICCRYTADRLLSLREKESEMKGRQRFMQSREGRHENLLENLVVKLGIYEIKDRSIPVELMCDRALWVVDTIKGIYNQHVAVYDDALRNRLLREQAITDVMETALCEKQFVVYFQPKYNLQGDYITGAEALVRWIHPEWGFMSPGEFIPLFEKNGFIRKLDEFVWEETCKKLREWMDKGYPLVPVSVNVSRADVYQHHLVEKFVELLETYRIDPAYLHLEVTESAYTENTEQIINTIEELRKRGFIIEMDDFGSGYSSLHMLSQISIDIVKLDMGFLRHELAKSTEESILCDIINMIHRLQLKVVAEGVETEKQKNYLQQIGCDYAQGYYYAKPMAGEEFEKYLIEYRDSFHSGENRDEYEKFDDSVNDEESKKTVLVIEDNAINRGMLESILIEQYRVLTAENGKQGLEVLAQEYQSVSAIILDVHMPVMDGYEFLERIRDNGIFCTIPVLVTTVLNSVEEEERCLGLGAWDFIGKPYNAKTILTRIRNMVHLKECDVIISELETDGLTGFKNRKTYYNDIAEIEANSKKNPRPIGVVFVDINGLKMTNDMKGHEAGDQLILEVAESMRRIFSDAKIYRLGGDEFVALSHGEEKAVFEEKVKALESSWKNGYSAAVGSVWVEQANELERQVALADQEMYRNKSLFYKKKNHEHGRKGIYDSERLLRKVDEISECLPGGFFIYKADEKEELISFNEELLKIYHCATREDFISLTGNSFRGMVHPQDWNRVKKEIDDQIKEENDLDYVEYRILCKDGMEKTVRDYGRFVHTEIYGDVYYVFINDITGN